MTPITVASLQMVSTPRLKDNLEVAQTLIQQAAQQGAKLVLLPEYFCFMGHNDTDKLALAEPFGDGPIQAFLAHQAQQHGVFVIAGTIPLQVPPSELAEGEPIRVYNSSLVFNPEGQCIARYDKIHMFCFTSGKEHYDEARVLKPGTQPVVAELLGLRVGLSVCYDLRFPELFRRMAPLDLIVMPAAFTYTTGQAHWELLNRARAVENQCYVLACGQGGRHENGRRTFGHSMLVGPWGEVENVRQEGPGVVLGRLDPAKIQQVRTSLPALSHRVL
jgi:predicted amidohydrolase